MNTHKDKRLGSKKLSLLIVLLIGLAVVLFFVLKIYTAHNNANKNNPDHGTNPNAINYGPPTEQDKKDVDQHKEALSQTPPSQPPGTVKSVTPHIVDASQYGQQVEVRSFVPDITEKGGTCTITFTKGSSKVTKQVAAVPDATTTLCANLSMDKSALPTSGTWSVVVNYSSPTAQGDSQAKSFEVQ